MVEGWIKLHRKFLNWEWYKKSDMVHLFIHILLNANHEKKTWQGINIERGQFLIGRKKLSESTGISEQSVRTCLSRLKSTNEITIKSTNKYSIITICNYDNYQLLFNNINQQTNQQIPINQPATNQQLTTTNNKKKEKNDNNKRKDIFNFKNSLIDLGIEEKIVSDWLKVRSKKKASNTETAFKKLKSEIEKSGATANECIKIAAENSWQGFKAEWIKNTPKSHQYGEY